MVAVIANEGRQQYETFNPWALWQHLRHHGLFGLRLSLSQSCSNTTFLTHADGVHTCAS